MSGIASYSTPFWHSIQYDLSPLPKRSRNAAICVRPTYDWKSTSITLSHHVELGVGDDEKGESSDDGVGARAALASAKKEHGADWEESEFNVGVVQYLYR